MPKTTIILEDDIYKKLVKEAVEKYGTTRTLSKLINENEESRRCQLLKIDLRKKKLKED